MAQCRERIKKLKKDYRKTADNNNVTGKKRKTCKFFDELDNILGIKPATKPSVIMSSEDGLQDDSDNEQTLLSPI